MAPKNPTNKKGFKDVLKSWRIGDYIRQLSVVVIGILITFQGSALIQRNAERRDAAHVLSMVKDELEKNYDRVGLQKEILVHEYTGAAVMKPYMHNPEAMPADSLNKYIDIVTRSRTLDYLNNSFDVLKSSLQIQTVRDKELLRDLFRTYENIDRFHDGVVSYNTLKTKGIHEYFSSLDSNTYDIMFKEDERQYFNIFSDIMKNSIIRNYIIATANGNNMFLIPDADALVDEMAAVIGKIDNEIQNKGNKRR